MRVLIACEFSGTVRDAFIARGHDAVSCDLLPTERPGPHMQGDVLNGLARDGIPRWDLMIAHPPCTHLAVSGARWFKDKLTEQEEALEFVRALMNAPIARICIENPRSIISTWIRRKDQVIHPHEFGCPQFKETWLWLKNLPHLVPTNRLALPEKGTEEWKRWNKTHRHFAPGPERGKNRSRFIPEWAEAMADQWGAGEFLKKPPIPGGFTNLQANLRNQATACLLEEKTRLQPGYLVTARTLVTIPTGQIDK